MWSRPFRRDWSGRSLLESEIRIADYDATAGQRRLSSRVNSGKQKGDPLRGAEAIIRAVMAEDAPLRLVLGKPALELGYKKLEAVKKELDDWKATTLGADFPEFQE